MNDRKEEHNKQPTKVDTGSVDHRRSAQLSTSSVCMIVAHAHSHTHEHAHTRSTLARASLRRPLSRRRVAIRARSFSAFAARAARRAIEALTRPAPPCAPTVSLSTRKPPTHTQRHTSTHVRVRMELHTQIHTLAQRCKSGQHWHKRACNICM